MRAILLFAVIAMSFTSPLQAKRCPPGYASRSQAYPGVPARWWWTLPLKHRR